MCGIAGIVGNKAVDPGEIERMTKAVSHRGPDGERYWSDESKSVLFGHRRLSIIDLTESGGQPMQIDRYVIIYNGEIYNYLELRERLIKSGFTFKGSSDTEVLLNLYIAEKENCLQYIDGMFAFAIYDSAEQTLFMARDRFGEKPLYYSFGEDKKFYFASEMKSFWAAGIPKNINYRLVNNYIQNNLVENPNDKKETFYSNIFRFPPAHYAKYDIAKRELNFFPYWDIKKNEINNSIGEEEIIENLRALLLKSVTRRLRSDVPVGTSLSGGLDSSLIVSLFHDVDPGNNFKVFSAQFPGFRKDESRYQQIIIDKFGLDSKVVKPDVKMFLRHINDVIYHQDEPFFCASNLAQFLVFKLAKDSGTKVLLDGQGADEIFAGYHSYYEPYLNGLKKKNPGLYKKELAAYNSLHADNEINKFYKKGWVYQFKHALPDSIISKLHSLKRHSGSSVLLNDDFRHEYNGFPGLLRKTTDLNESLYYSTRRYGLESLLRYADRDSMAHGVEVRLPFLYHELVEFVFSLPDHYKIRDGWTKWILRKAFSRDLPKEIIWRKDKIGYEAPQVEWMRAPEFAGQINDAKNKLIDDRILKPSALSVEDDEMNWRFLMIANTLFGNVSRN